MFACVAVYFLHSSHLHFHIPLHIEKERGRGAEEKGRKLPFIARLRLAEQICNGNAWCRQLAHHVFSASDLIPQRCKHLNTLRGCCVVWRRCCCRKDWRNRKNLRLVSHNHTHRTVQRIGKCTLSAHISSLSKVVTVAFGCSDIVAVWWCLKQVFPSSL